MDNNLTIESTLDRYDREGFFFRTQDKSFLQSELERSFENMFLSRYNEILCHESITKLDDLLGNYMDTDKVKLHDMAVGARNAMDWLQDNGFPKEFRTIK
jgi:hypothetical protein